LFQALGPRQKMYVALLEMDNRLIAYEWGFRTPDRILPYNKAYLPEYGRFSPGTMLVPAVIDFGYRQGCREYDFSRGEQPYKWRWATESRPSLRVEIWSPRIRSRLARIGFLSVRPLALRALSALRIRYTPSWEL
jgi:CelD/BcsL family acetyltransferase involved in cellulose biosynthesis